MKKTLFAAGLLALASGGFAVAGEQQARISVGGLFCGSCAYIAAEAMKSVDDSVEIVKFIRGDTYDTAVYVVSYDDANATPSSIADAVVSYGYPAQVVANSSS
ncbi:MAG: periplasmic mercury ion-binding protein [Paracoccaceae bacterium]